MKSLYTAAVHLISDESGTAITEYAIMLGLVILGCIAVAIAFGEKLVTRWTNLGAIM